MVLNGPERWREYIRWYFSRVDISIVANPLPTKFNPYVDTSLFFPSPGEDVVPSNYQRCIMRGGAHIYSTWEKLNDSLGKKKKGSQSELMWPLISHRKVEIRSTGFLM